MTGPGGGGFETDPQQLRNAAAMLDAASAALEVTDAQIQQGAVGSVAFGASGQAETVAEQWMLALSARASEAAELNGATTRLADRLRAAADNYERSDTGNQHLMNTVDPAHS
ncbi:hypothetical protein F0L68_31265 [Solihabitans fulvus]|uniref:Excreted virulence factor EspC, type VII ESX diderm n=1 Tax=Solihabitans fulvus TaxID=1892852 RepID=A0A5B2WTR8_9PSEU|nr:type VII secretion target [Solihabitans fulvus]KAA2254092.1 hypothetical protein F0L68_31265 [Solihabitans fulvus]